MDVWQQGDLDRATALLEEAVERFAAVGVRRGQHWAAVALGQIALERGDQSRAWHWFREAVTLCHAVSERRWLAVSLEGAAALVADDEAQSTGRFDAASQILGAAGLLREQVGLPIPPSEQRLIDRAEAAARTALGDAAFEAAQAEGAALPLDEAVDVAVAALAQATDRT